MELLTIILDSHMMYHFNTCELLYAFVFHTCDFDNYAWYDSPLNRSNVTNHVNDSVNFDPYNAGNMIIKISNMEYKWTIFNQQWNKVSCWSVG